MPIPRFCPNPACPNHFRPSRLWSVHFGSYHTRAHGIVPRYRCRSCSRTCSDQTESVHYYAKRRVPLKAIWLSLLGGASLREIARRYALSCPVVQNALLRLGRQAMAAQLQLLEQLHPRTTLVYDGLRSFVSSQDYPCDITTVVEPEGETILSMTHTVMRRTGTMSCRQRQRVGRKQQVWRPEKGTMKKDISLLIRELWDYLRPSCEAPAEIRTDEHPLYRALLTRDPLCAHFRAAGLLVHRRTPGTAVRTFENPLFAVNYVERLLRHRLKEHARETIAFGRNATMQMHRAWIFACDHNCRREYRVKQPQLGVHAGQAAVRPQVVRQVGRQFFVRRIRVPPIVVPESIQRVWTAQVMTPPMRWRVGQRASSVKVPSYALCDLALSYQHAA